MVDDVQFEQLSVVIDLCEHIHQHFKLIDCLFILPDYRLDAVPGDDLD